MNRISNLNVQVVGGLCHVILKFVSPIEIASVVVLVTIFRLILFLVPALDIFFPFRLPVEKLFSVRTEIKFVSVYLK